MLNITKFLVFMLLLLLASCLMPSYALAQKTTKTVPLRGIIVEGDFLKDTYFYGTKKLNSPYDLTIPFMEIEDKEVDRLYKSYKTMRRLSSIAAFLPTFYVFYSLNGNNRSTYSNEFGWSLLGVSVAANVGFSMLSRVKIRKAINRYNELILNDDTPQSFHQMPAMNLVSIGWKYKF